MEKIRIIGSSKLKGEVIIGGAKNAAVGILPAALLINGVTTIDNLPDISDVKKYYKILEEVGAKIEYIDTHKIKIDTRNISSHIALSENVRKFRASYYLLGALLGRLKKSKVAMPGGCNIGVRPIDLHEKGFIELGSEIEAGEDYLEIKAENLVGKQIYLDVVSVGATINIMLAATLAEGETIIENAAKEPHIVDVANFLNMAGAEIIGAGTDKIKIIGKDSLNADIEYSVVPDQIEAGTFMIAAAASKGDVTIRRCVPKHMETLTIKLREAGVIVEEKDDTIRVVSNGDFKGIKVKTLPYPGFPTDLQSQMGVFLSVAKGKSVIVESIWESRFLYVDELIKMGANATKKGDKVEFLGVDKLKGADVEATDLRAGASLIIAGIIAEGETTISNIYHIDRGYEKIEEKFEKLGANISREHYND